MYRRVSTIDQVDHGHSLPQQEQAMLDYCRARGWEVVASFEDKGKSGRSRSKRPGLEAALAAVCGHKGVLVVYSLSRLARSIVDAAAILKELKGCGAGLAIVDMAIDTSTPHGELIFNIFASLAQFESQQIGERIKGVNKYRTAQMGYRTQGVQPAGWTIAEDGPKKGQRVPVKAEQRVLERVALMRAKYPDASCEALARRLNARRVPTIGTLRSGVGGAEIGAEGRWCRRKVRNLLLVIQENGSSRVSSP